MPEFSSVATDVAGNEILSNLDFKIESESDTPHGQQLKLKLGNGKVKLKLDAGFGKVYLRKK